MRYIIGKYIDKHEIIKEHDVIVLAKTNFMEYDELVALLSECVIDKELTVLTNEQGIKSYIRFS